MSEVRHYWPEEIVDSEELVVYLQDYAVLEAENERLRTLTTVQEAVACVFDWLKSSACNTDDEDRSTFLDELAEDVIEFAPDYKRQWKDTVSMSATIKRLEKELAALKAVPDGVVGLGYQQLFNAIAYATDSGDEPTTISVKRFLSCVGPLMTVAQHNSIVAALRQPVDDEWEAFCDGHCTWLDHHPSCTVLSAPAAGQDVSALVEALEECAAALAWNCFGECRAIHAGPIIPATEALELAKAVLVAHKAGGAE